MGTICDSARVFEQIGLNNNVIRPPPHPLLPTVAIDTQTLGVIGWAECNSFTEKMASLNMIPRLSLVGEKQGKSFTLKQLLIQYDS